MTGRIRNERIGRRERCAAGLAGGADIPVPIHIPANASWIEVSLSDLHRS